MEEVKEYLKREMENQNFDSISLGALDFNTGKITTTDYQDGNFRSKPLIYDLASLTKPLTLGIAFFIDPDVFNNDLLNLLQHQGGLPSWARLPKNGWKEIIKRFPVIKSKTDYSDLGALRLMLEIEAKIGITLQDYVQAYWADNIVFWKELALTNDVVDSGSDSRGVVHDPNAFVINRFCSHAGLFGSAEAVLKTLKNIEDQFKVIDKFTEVIERVSYDQQRFVFGFDRVNPENTYSCNEPHELMVGHLGFTGTCFWIDLKKKKAFTVLSNGTVNYWYSKDSLNKVRRNLGQMLLEL